MDKSSISQQSEQRMSEISTSLLNVIFEGAIDGILLVDVKTKRFVSCNPALCRMLGYSPKEIARLGIEDMHPAEDLPHILEQFEKQVHGENKLATDIPFKRRDGTLLYADITSAPVKSGCEVYLVGIIRDVSERRQLDETRRISALKYQLLFESSRDALMTLAPPSWKFTGANESALKLFGLASTAEFTSLGPWEVSPEYQPDGRLSSEKAQEMIATAMREGSNFFEWEHQRLDGLAFAADVLLTRMAFENEVYLQANVRDITLRKQSARLLAEAQIIAESEDKFRKITESSYDAIVMMGADRCISLWNPAAERLFGYTTQEALGREMHPLLAPASANQAFELGFKDFQQSGRGAVVGKTLALTALRKGGTELPVEVTISALQINGRWNAIGIFRDMTEHKLNEEKIRKLAFYDSLTQLPNRRLLDDRLVQAMATSKRSGRYAALMFVDLDNFKPLNDRHGHYAGDLLLIEVAQRITRCLRETDTVARFGGDEFVVLLSELDTDKLESISQTHTVAEKIRTALAEVYYINVPADGTAQHHCTSSIGVVVFLNHECSTNEVLRRADMAMYQAKNCGRNKVCFLDCKS